MMGLACASAFTIDAPLEGAEEHPPRYNKNYQTAIGIGDEPISIVDRFGQLKSDDANVPELANAARGGGSRNLKVLIDIGARAQPISTLTASQWLEDGYLPIVHTKAGAAAGEFHSVTFSSSAGDVKADYLGISATRNSLRVKLLCTTATSVSIRDGLVHASNQILASVPVPAGFKISNAKYNCLTPERNSRVFPSSVAWEGLPHTSCPKSLDPAFSGARTASTTVEYLFPVTGGKTYYVFLGVGNPTWLVGDPAYFKVVKLSLDDQSQTVDLRSTQPDRPFLRLFEVTPAGSSIRVRSEGLEGGPLLSGIWVFERAPDPSLVATGRLNDQAHYYVPCGREPASDIVSSIDLEYSPTTQAGTRTWIQLPYSLRPEDGQKATAILPELALSATKEHWNSFLVAGAQFLTGVPHLDHLYKTSLLNLFLLRTKFSGAGHGGQDIYVVKPGATIYDSFWYRDGAYIIAAMDAAGHPEEAEKSLRLFTDPDLTGTLKGWSQQASGLWESPHGEWDSQGQALWALIHHYELSGDESWLRKIYPNIRRGALWIKNGTDQTKRIAANGEPPIFWGLLPKGVSEDTGSSDSTYIYEHDFWGVLGLREAIKAAKHLGREEDVGWMTETCREFQTNLLASVKRAYKTTGRGEFIPADPFDPDLDINGDIAAVYPTRFLDARDPMISGSLERIARHSREDLYTWFKTLNNGDMWTYMTVDWAMCYMLRDELPVFYKLFRSYTDHASPTNAWPECIYSDSRLGTGDTPHGWAAASYVLLHRNSLVYENEGKLELCWGVHPEWLGDGAHLSVRRAPTRFGKVDFDLSRSGSELTFEHKLVSNSSQPRPNEIRLHVPLSTRQDIRSVRLNGKVQRSSSEESVFRID